MQEAPLRYHQFLKKRQLMMLSKEFNKNGTKRSQLVGMNLKLTLQNMVKSEKSLKGLNNNNKRR